MFRPHEFHSRYHSQTYTYENYDRTKNREPRQAKDIDKGAGSEVDVFDYYWKHPLRWAYSCRSLWGMGYGIGTVKFATSPPKRTADVDATTNDSASPKSPTGPSQQTVAAQVDREFDPISGRMVSKDEDPSADMQPKSDAAKNRPQDDVCSGEGTKASPEDVINVPPPTHEEFHVQMTEEKDPGDTNGSPKDTPLVSDLTGNDNETPRVIMADSPKAQNELSPEQSTDFPQGEASNKLSKENVISICGAHVRRARELGTYKEDMENDSEREDLEFLSANDIRAPYDSKKPASETHAEKQEFRRSLEDELDCYVDPASGVDAQDIRARYKHKMSNSEADRVPLSTSEGELQSSDHSRAEPCANVEPSQVPETEYPSVNQSTSSPAMYRILAYDSSTLQMTTSETSSSQHTSNGTLPLTEVLSRLNNAAKFMPYFAKMHNDGYEIVSGGGDILVFKKVREVGERPKDETKSATARSPDAAPHEAGSLPEEVKFEQDATEQIIDNKQSQPTQPTQSQRKVQRQETVYAGGPPNWSPYPPPPPPTTHDQPATEAATPPPKKESTFRKTLRRMFLAGGATAATCYAIGVVTEYFRTGGQDGRGIDGFTEFESERRRRD